MRHLHATVDTADHQTFFAPVELEGLALLEAERHESARRVAFAAAPLTGEIGDAAIAAGVALGFDVKEQGLAGSAVLLDAQRIGLEGQFQSGMKRRELGRYRATPVARWGNHYLFRLPEPLAQRVAGQSRAF